jgi:hypothetical protein
MKTSLLRLGCAAVLLCGIAASADVTIEYTGLSDVVIQNVSITGAGGNLGGPNYSGGVYTGLYNAKVVETGVTWQTFCIDPIGEISPSVPWNATLLTSTELANGKGVLNDPAYGNDPGLAQDKYGMIGYLANQYYYNTDATFNTAADRSDLSLAFWEIARDYTGSRESMSLTGGDFQSSAGQSDQDIVTNLLNAAFGHRDDSYSFSVFSPTERPSQEFLAFRVPEPALFGMLLTGLFALGGLGIVRRRKTI